MQGLQVRRPRLQALRTQEAAGAEAAGAEVVVGPPSGMAQYHAGVCGRLTVWERCLSMLCDNDDGQYVPKIACSDDTSGLIELALSGLTLADLVIDWVGFNLLDL